MFSNGSVEKSRQVCPHSQELVRGGGHGDGMGFSFGYCRSCKDFVEWDSFGLGQKDKLKIQHWIRNNNEVSDRAD